MKGKVNVKLTNGCRRFIIVETYSGKEIHKSGVYKNPDNMKHAMYEYVVHNGLLVGNTVVF